jgi:F-type H+-transporting ATPase subunit b
MNFNLTLIAQALVFAAFIWFTVKFVWPPLLRAIEAGRRRSPTASPPPSRASARSSNPPSRRMNPSAGARPRRRGDRAGPRSGRADGRGGENAAKAEGDREKAAAKADIQQEAQRARDSCASRSPLAVAGAEKILRREVDAKAHAELLDGSRSNSNGRTQHHRASLRGSRLQAGRRAGQARRLVGDARQPVGGGGRRARARGDRRPESSAAKVAG